MTPTPRKGRARAIAWLAGLGAALWGAPADAQTTAPGITVTTTGITHSDQGSRPQDFPLKNVNHNDCIQDDVMSFPVNLVNYTGTTFEVWAGSGCDVAMNRTNSNNTTCWLVHREVSIVQNPSVLIHVRDMLAGTGAPTTTSTDGGTTDGGTTSNTNLPPTGDLVEGTSDAICTPPAGTISTQQPLTLYFLLITNQVGDTAAATYKYDIAYKLIGPPPPINLSAGVGESQLVVHFDVTPSNGDPLSNGFNAYCDPPRGAGPIDGGVTDAGADGGLACPTSSVLVPNADPPGKNFCGSSLNRGATTVTATGLVNDVPYNVAVAAVDTFFNTGPLSESACQSPKPVTSFYQSYRDAGGRGGGGFCSISQRRTGAASFALLGLVGLGMFLRRRAR